MQRLDLGVVRVSHPVEAVASGPRLKKRRPIAVELKIGEKTNYVEGEELFVTVQAAESGHLRLLYQNAKGEVYTLFPNQFNTDDRIEGGRRIQVFPAPDPKAKRPGDKVRLKVETESAFGTEHLVAVMTDQTFADDTELRKALVTAKFVQDTVNDVEQLVTKNVRSKDVRVESDSERESQKGGARVGVARVTITTQPKTPQPKN